MDPDLLSNSSHRFTTRFDNNYNGRYKRKDDLVVELLSGDVTSPCDDRLKGTGIHGQSEFSINLVRYSPRTVVHESLKGSRICFLH